MPDLADIIDETMLPNTKPEKMAILTGRLDYKLEDIPDNHTGSPWSEVKAMTAEDKESAQDIGLPERFCGDHDYVCPGCEESRRSHVLELAIKFSMQPEGIKFDCDDVVEAAKAFEAYLKGE